MAGLGSVSSNDPLKNTKKYKNVLTENDRKTIIKNYINNSGTQSKQELLVLRQNPNESLEEALALEPMPEANILIKLIYDLADFESKINNFSKQNQQSLIYEVPELAGKLNDKSINVETSLDQITLSQEAKNLFSALLKKGLGIKQSPDIKILNDLSTQYDNAAQNQEDLKKITIQLETEAIKFGVRETFFNDTIKKVLDSKAPNAISKAFFLLKIKNFQDPIENDVRTLAKDRWKTHESQSFEMLKQFYKETTNGQLEDTYPKKLFQSLNTITKDSEKAFEKVKSKIPKGVNSTEYKEWLEISNATLSFKTFKESNMDKVIQNQKKEISDSDNFKPDAFKTLITRYEEKYGVETKEQALQINRELFALKDLACSNPQNKLMAILYAFRMDQPTFKDDIDQKRNDIISNIQKGKDQLSGISEADLTNIITTIHPQNGPITTDWLEAVVRTGLNRPTQHVPTLEDALMDLSTQPYSSRLETIAGTKENRADFFKEMMVKVQTDKRFEKWRPIFLTKLTKQLHRLSTPGEFETIQDEAKAKNGFEKTLLEIQAKLSVKQKATLKEMSKYQDIKTLHHRLAVNDTSNAITKKIPSDVLITRLKDPSATPSMVRNNLEELYMRATEISTSNREPKDILDGIDNLILGLKAVSKFDDFENPELTHVYKKCMAWLEMAVKADETPTLTKNPDAYAKQLIEMTPADQKKTWLKKMLTQNSEAFKYMPGFTQPSSIRDVLQKKIGHITLKGRNITLISSKEELWKSNIENAKEEDLNKWLLSFQRYPKTIEQSLKFILDTEPPAQDLKKAFFKELEKSATQKNTRENILNKIPKNSLSAKEIEHLFLQQKDIKEAIIQLTNDLKGHKNIHAYTSATNPENFHKEQTEKNSVGLKLNEKIIQARRQKHTRNIQKHLEKFEKLEHCIAVLEAEIKTTTYETDKNALIQKKEELETYIKNTLSDITGFSSLKELKEELSKQPWIGKQTKITKIDTKLMKYLNESLHARSEWSKKLESKQFEIESQLLSAQNAVTTFADKSIQDFINTAQTNQLEIHQLLYSVVPSKQESSVYAALTAIDNTIDHKNGKSVAYAHLKFVEELKKAFVSGGFKINESGDAHYTLENEFKAVLTLLFEKSNYPHDANATATQLFNNLTTKLKEGNIPAALYDPKNRKELNEQIFKLFHPEDHINGMEALRFTHAPDYISLENAYRTSKNVQRLVLEMKKNPAQYTPMDKIYIAKSIAGLRKDFENTTGNKEILMETKRRVLEAYDRGHHSNSGMSPEMMKQRIHFLKKESNITKQSNIQSENNLDQADSNAISYTLKALIGGHITKGEDARLMFEALAVRVDDIRHQKVVRSEECLYMMDKLLVLKERFNQGDKAFKKTFLNSTEEELETIKKDVNKTFEDTYKGLITLLLQQANAQKSLINDIELSELRWQGKGELETTVFHNKKTAKISEHIIELRQQKVRNRQNQIREMFKKQKIHFVPLTANNSHNTHTINNPGQLLQVMKPLLWQLQADMHTLSTKLEPSYGEVGDVDQQVYNIGDIISRQVNMAMAELKKTNPTKNLEFNIPILPPNVYRTLNDGTKIWYNGYENIGPKLESLYQAAFGKLYKDGCLVLSIMHFKEIAYFIDGAGKSQEIAKAIYRDIAPSPSQKNQRIAGKLNDKFKVACSAYSTDLEKDFNVEPRISIPTKALLKNSEKELDYWRKVVLDFESTLTEEEISHFNSDKNTAAKDVLETKFQLFADNWYKTNTTGIQIAWKNVTPIDIDLLMPTYVTELATYFTNHHQNLQTERDHKQQIADIKHQETLEYAAKNKNAKTAFFQKTPISQNTVSTVVSSNAPIASMKLNTHEQNETLKQLYQTESFIDFFEHLNYEDQRMFAGYMQRHPDAIDSFKKHFENIQYDEDWENCPVGLMPYIAINLTDENTPPTTTREEKIKFISDVLTWAHPELSKESVDAIIQSSGAAAFNRNIQELQKTLLGLKSTFDTYTYPKDLETIIFSALKSTYDESNPVPLNAKNASSIAQMLHDMLEKPENKTNEIVDKISKKTDALIRLKDLIPLNLYAKGIITDLEKLQQQADHEPLSDYSLSALFASIPDDVNQVQILATTLNQAAEHALNASQDTDLTLPENDLERYSTQINTFTKNVEDKTKAVEQLKTTIKLKGELDKTFKEYEKLVSKMPVTDPNDRLEFEQPKKSLEDVLSNILNLTNSETDKKLEELTNISKELDIKLSALKATYSQKINDIKTKLETEAEELGKLTHDDLEGHKNLKIKEAQEAITSIEAAKNLNPNIEWPSIPDLEAKLKSLEKTRDGLETYLRVDTLEREFERFANQAKNEECINSANKLKVQAIQIKPPIKEYLEGLSSEGSIETTYQTIKDKTIPSLEQELKKLQGTSDDLVSAEAAGSSGIATTQTTPETERAKVLIDLLKRAGHVSKSWEELVGRETVKEYLGEKKYLQESWYQLMTTNEGKIKFSPERWYDTMQNGNKAAQVLAQALLDTEDSSDQFEKECSTSLERSEALLKITQNNLILFETVKSIQEKLRQGVDECQEIISKFDKEKTQGPTTLIKTLWSSRVLIVNTLLEEIFDNKETINNEKLTALNKSVSVLEEKKTSLIAGYLEQIVEIKTKLNSEQGALKNLNETIRKLDCLPKIKNDIEKLIAQQNEGLLSAFKKIDSVTANIKNPPMKIKEWPSLSELLELVGKSKELNLSKYLENQNKGLSSKRETSNVFTQSNIINDQMGQDLLSGLQLRLDKASGEFGALKPKLTSNQKGKIKAIEEKISSFSAEKNNQDKQKEGYLEGRIQTIKRLINELKVKYRLEIDNANQLLKTELDTLKELQTVQNLNSNSLIETQIQKVNEGIQSITNVPSSEEIKSQDKNAIQNWPSIGDLLALTGKSDALNLYVHAEKYESRFENNKLKVSSTSELGKSISEAIETIKNDIKPTITNYLGTNPLTDEIKNAYNAVRDKIKGFESIDEKLKEFAAIKIQARIRGFLARKNPVKPTSSSITPSKNLNLSTTSIAVVNASTISENDLVKLRDSIQKLVAEILLWIEKLPNRYRETLKEKLKEIVTSINNTTTEEHNNFDALQKKVETFTKYLEKFKGEYKGYLEAVNKKLDDELKGLTEFHNDLIKRNIQNEIQNEIITSISEHKNKIDAAFEAIKQHSLDDVETCPGIDSLESLLGKCAELKLSIIKIAQDTKNNATNNKESKPDLIIPKTIEDDIVVPERVEKMSDEEYKNGLKALEEGFEKLLQAIDENHEKYTMINQKKDKIVKEMSKLRKEENFERASTLMIYTEALKKFRSEIDLPPEVGQ